MQQMIGGGSITKHEIRASLIAAGWHYSTSEINSALYGSPEIFLATDDSLPCWSIRRGVRPAAAPLEPVDCRYANHYHGPAPREWQVEAFEAWVRGGNRGVVEAVTGTGKTMVGVLAVADAAARGMKSLVLVPSKNLLDQWFSVLSGATKGLRIARLGDGNAGDLRTCDILVATVHTAAKHRMLSEGTRGLLVADEVHRYGAETFSMALEPTFEYRLGLTATYEREDRGIEEYLSAYFRPKDGLLRRRPDVVFECSYARGLNDGILAPFRVGLVPAQLTALEKLEYDDWDQKARKLRWDLISEHKCPAGPFGDFMKEVSRLADGGIGTKTGTSCARAYLNAFTKRKALLAGSTQKIELLGALARSLSRANRALVFSETVTSAKEAAQLLAARGLPALDYTSELSSDERRRRLDRFRSGQITVLAAPRVLDEGVDVPEADLGVIVAASRSRRQMIQRMGRIIRPKSDGRQATFIIMYAADTSEDPQNGAHDAFLGEMMDNATEVHQFPRALCADQLEQWYLS